MNLTEKQLDTLRHMLGINDPSVREPKPFRNYYAASHGSHELDDLVKLGAVEFDQKHGDYDYYHCTPAGKIAAIESHRLIRYTKKKRVYLKWLHIADALPDLTFKEFLTSDDFRQSRSEA
jgi:hypothetical protein